MDFLSAVGLNGDAPNWTLFWTAFGAIGGILGSLATTVAIVVALWQTRYPYKKRIKLKFSDCTIIATENMMKLPPLISIDISNVGNKDVFIKEWGFKCRDGKRMKFFPELSSANFPYPLARTLFPSFPIHLSIDEMKTLNFEQQKFLQAVLNCVQEKSLKRNRKVVIYVKDSVGTDYYKKTGKTVDQLLSMLSQTEQTDNKSSEV